MHLITDFSVHFYLWLQNDAITSFRLSGVTYISIPKDIKSNCVYESFPELGGAREARNPHYNEQAPG